MTIPQRPTGAPLPKAVDAPVKLSDRPLFPQYPTYRSNRPTRALSFNQLVELASSPLVRLKASVSCVTPYYAEAKTKEVALVSQYHAIVVDHDHDDLGIGALQHIYAQLHVPYLAYTTSSHTAEERRYRVIIPLAEPVNSDRYQELAAGIAQYLGTDAAQARAQQIFFLPNKIAEDSEYWSIFSKDFMPLPPNDASHPFVASAAVGWNSLLTELAQVERSETTPLRAKPQQAAGGNASGVVEKFLQTYDVECQLTAAGYISNGRGAYKCPTGQSGGFGVNIMNRDGKQTCFSHHGLHDPLSADNNGGHALDAFDVYVALSHGGDYSAAVAFIAPQVDTEGQHERQVTHAKEKAEKEEQTFVNNLSLSDPIKPIGIREAVASKAKTNVLAVKFETDVGWLGKDYDPHEDYSWPLLPNGKPNPSGNKFESLHDYANYVELHQEEQLYVSIAKMLMRKVDVVDPSVCLLMAASVLVAIAGQKVKGGFPERGVSTPALELLLVAPTGFGKTSMANSIRAIIEMLNPGPMHNVAFVSATTSSRQGLYDAYKQYCGPDKSIYSFSDEATSLFAETERGATGKAELKEYMLTLFDGAVSGILPNIAAAGINSRPALPNFHITSLRCATPAVLDDVFGANADSGTTNRHVVLIPKFVVVCQRQQPTINNEEERDQYARILSKLSSVPNWFVEKLHAASSGRIGNVVASTNNKVTVRLEGTGADYFGDNSLSRIVHSLQNSENPLLRRTHMHLTSILTAVTFFSATEVLGDNYIYPTRAETVFWKNQLEAVSNRLLEESGEMKSGLSTGSEDQDAIVRRIQEYLKGNVIKAIKDNPIALERLDRGIISLTHLTAQLAACRPFKRYSSRSEATRMVNAAVDALVVDSRFLRKLTDEELAQEQIVASASTRTNFYRIIAPNLPNNTEDETNLC